MATVTKKSSAPASERPEPGTSGGASWPLRALDGVYRFLASLKLAVILLTTLAATLTFATFYEKAHGTPATQLEIYRSKPFALLLALLGVNILCAATIRFPWKRRQTGFVITHLGLLIVLAGSFVSLKVTSEGQLALLEGTSGSRFVKIDEPVFRVQKLDESTGEPERAFVLPFSPGGLAWDSQEQAAAMRDPAHRAGIVALRAAYGLIALGLLAGVVYLGFRHGEWVGRPLGAAVATLATLSAVGIGGYAAFARFGPRQDVLTQPSDPFRLVVKDYLPSATAPQPVRLPGKDGVPMLRVALLAQPPGATEMTDRLGGRGWLISPDDTLDHGAIDVSPARLEFQYLEGPHAVEALRGFLHPPDDPLKTRLARLHYRDRQGRARVYEWTIEDEQSIKMEGGRPVRSGKSVELPDSDLTASLVGVVPMPTRDPRLLAEVGQTDVVRKLESMGRALASSVAYTAVFSVKRGDGPEVMHFGWAGLPTGPSVLPRGGEPDEPLLWIDYFHPPELAAEGGPMMAGNFGVVQFAVTADGRTFYRAFGRKGLVGAGPIKMGEPNPIFGGERMPMKVSVRVDEFLESGITRMVCEPRPLPPNEMDKAIPAALVSMTVKGETREFWLLRSMREKPFFETERFESGPWRLSFDSVHGDLPFQVNLVDFNPSNDPGSRARASYRSDVYVGDLDARPPSPEAFRDLAAGSAFQFLDRPRETYVKTAATQYRPFDGVEAVTIADPDTSVRPSPSPTKIVMNYPLERENWTIYQSSFQPELDANDDPTGTYTSIFTVRYDPAWPIIYGGCLLVVAGTFVQFYMRAGVFTDGGKRERARAEARARREAGQAEPIEVGEADVVL